MPKRHSSTPLSTLNCIKAWNSGRDLCRATAQVKPRRTSAEQRHRSTLFNLCLWRAEVCNQEAEVGEGADEGAESLPTDFYKDLECFLLAISAYSFNGLRSKALRNL